MWEDWVKKVGHSTQCEALLFKQDRDMFVAGNIDTVLMTYEDKWLKSVPDCQTPATARIATMVGLATYYD